jgi:hypothetical protein
MDPGFEAGCWMLVPRVDSGVRRVECMMPVNGRCPKQNDMGIPKVNGRCIFGLRAFEIPGISRVKAQRDYEKKLLERVRGKE